MKLLAILVIVSSTFGARAQSSSAIQYGHVFVGVSSVKGKGLILSGKPSEQGFLKGMAATQKKGTFICDNIEAQQAKSHGFSLSPDSRFTWNVSGSIWPVDETFVICGTVTIQQPYRNDQVDTDFTFAAWGSATAYPDVTQQIPSITFAYVDFCPQDATNCETTAVHPEPAMPVRMARVAGRLLVHDCITKARLTGGTVQVVLSSTEEGRAFNDSPETRNVCDNIPASFGQKDTSVEVDLRPIADSRRYALNVPIVGRRVPAIVYICALADVHKGLDSASCEESVSHVFFWRKATITLEPNETNVVDIRFDGTEQH